MNRVDTGIQVRKRELVSPPIALLVLGQGLETPLYAPLLPVMESGLAEQSSRDEYSNKTRRLFQKKKNKRNGFDLGIESFYELAQAA